MVSLCILMYRYTMACTNTHSHTHSQRQLSGHVIKPESTRVSRWQRLPLGTEGWSSWSTPWVRDREREREFTANKTSKCDSNCASAASKHLANSLGQSQHVWGCRWKALCVYLLQQLYMRYLLSTCLRSWGKRKRPNKKIKPHIQVVRLVVCLF